MFKWFMRYIPDYKISAVLPCLCCDAIPQQDFNPILFPISVQV